MISPGEDSPTTFCKSGVWSEDGVPHYPQRRGGMVKDLSGDERLLDLAGRSCPLMPARCSPLMLEVA
jgi:hypothetical protein